MSESKAARKSRNSNLHCFPSRSVAHKTMKQYRPWPTSSFSSSVRSSVVIEVPRTKDDNNTVTIATMAMAATAILLGGTFQHEHQRLLQEQENGLKKKDGLASTIIGSQSSVEPVESVSTEPPLSHSNKDDQETERLIHHRPELFEVLSEELQSNSSDAFTTRMEPLRRQAVKNPTSSQFHQPRNVMISRMRSIKGRGLNEKYNVEWNTVLGEGAYGSVHPARLALTGEKVALKKISKRYTNSSDFFSETDALLQIYDNGGHPNISGLRDMVSLN